MRRRSLLRVLGLAPLAAVAAPLAPLVHRAMTTAPSLRGIAEGVAKFSDGRLRFMPYADTAKQGPWLGYIDDAEGVTVAWVDVARRVWWAVEKGVSNVIERGSVIP